MINFYEICKHYFVCYFNTNERRDIMLKENDLDSMCGVSDEELTKRFREAVRIENEIKRIKGLPIAKYDFKRNFLI